MPQPRKHLICTDTTPYYHITTRCVRRAFLCGQDPLTGKSFEHRRQWIEDRIRILSSIFALDICAYAVMSNHYHLVVKLTHNKTKTWTDNEVLRRWRCLFKGPLLIQRYAEQAGLSIAEFDTVKSILAVYRHRLGDISWFMKCLNESIARKANAEDDVTGHFWEARFSSDALSTDQSILTCMAYVDLNPVRAGIAETPELSSYTSIRERVTQQWKARRAIRELIQDKELRHFDLEIRPLMTFSDSIDHGQPLSLPIAFTDYLTLLDWSGRMVRADKRGSIPDHVPPVLERLKLSSDQWLHNTTGFEAHPRRMAATVFKKN